MDIQKIREQFPILREKNRDKELIYFDSAATSLRPISVIGSEILFYQEYGASIHRSVYELGEKATNAYENTRKKVAQFIGSDNSESIVFTKSATESINLVADAWGFKNLKKNDIVLLTDMEHHSNIVPWQIICEKTGAKVQYIKSTKDGTLDLEELDDVLNEKVIIVSFTHVSNVFGTINPAKTIIDKAHKNGSLVLLDGCQSAPHIKIDVKELDCDFFVFSAHKMLGPTGIGVVWGKKELLEKMDPVYGGGDMIEEVYYDKATWAPIPHKFEAGTPPYVEAIGLGAAVDYLSDLSMVEVQKHSDQLRLYAKNSLENIDGLNIIHTDSENAGCTFAMSVDGAHATDISLMLDTYGVAVRAGHHCVQPFHRKLNIDATFRATGYIYNDENDFDTLVNAIEESLKILR